MANLWSTIQNNLNFFRVHVLFFTFTPLIFSGIFYAANGEIHISYIDALFNCASAAFVCGLASVDLSSLTGFQQGLLFFQACIGSPVVVSWVMVYMRRRYFAKRFEHIVEAEIEKRKALAEQQGDRPPGATWGRRLTRALTFTTPLSPVPENGTDSHGKDEKGGGGDGKKKPGIFNRKTLRNLRTDMIRRMDDAPRPIDPNGWITQPQSPEPEYTEPEVNEKANGIKGIATPVATDDSAANSSSSAAPILARTSTIQPSNTRSGVPLGHTLTVEFKTPDREFRGRRPSYIDNGLSTRSRSDTGSRRYSTSMDVVHDDRDFVPPGGVPLTRRTTTMHTARSQRSVPAHSAINRGYGGFPHPHVLLLRLVKKFFPSVEQRFLRTVTLPRTQTFLNAPSQGPSGSVNAEGGKTVQYISFDAIVGRNSKFHLLTEEHLQELGGVEYRALTALLWIVGGYHFCVQLMAFTVIAPYISLHRWRSTFEPPNLHRYVPPPWFAAFQVVSAYTNAGMSLVDQSMVPFQKAYPMVLVMALLILAGNTAFPIFLRFTIWIITKLVPYRSRINETLHFLLDHPRRCFIYLFPSHQTWFLLTVLVMLNGTDWFFFLVLDIGNSTFATVPLGVRFIIGLLQATCVRAAGFATVTLSSLAPAVQALYVMMMYISIYPIAMSVRSTNVYEEKSLGVFDDEDEEDDMEAGKRQDGESRVAVWGRYLAWHARRQLAFDMWWLGLALFLVCIIERGKIQNEQNLQWFTIFTIIFELISAYGGVGLSLGVPYANFSFSGALTPLSKLIVIAVMLRGRHRGLPVAIDRAVLLPFEFGKAPGAKDAADANLEETYTHTGENGNGYPNYDDAGTARDAERRASPVASLRRSPIAEQPSREFSQPVSPN